VRSVVSTAVTQAASTVTLAMGESVKTPIRRPVAGVAAARANDDAGEGGDHHAPGS
jgi:hypothetical protein